MEHAFTGKNSLNFLSVNLLRYILTVAWALLSFNLWSQTPPSPGGDTIFVYEPDTLPPRGERFHLNSFGVNFRDGSHQFFDGYNYQILNANAREGLPVFLDWPDFSGAVILPTYWQVEGHAAWVDTSRGIKIRTGLTYMQRKDSMQTGSEFSRYDTIYGRNASEFGHFYGFTAAAMKQSRKFWGFLRLYGGAEVEAMVSPRSDIYFLLYAYDIGEERIVDLNEFEVEGKPRFNLYASALLGLETVFWKHFGFFLEVKSGLGGQFVLREQTFGMAKNAYHLGLNWYLWDYKRKPMQRREIIIPPPPNPE